MPSSPKSFKAWPSSVYSRRSTVLILCSLIGLAGFVFGFIAISKQNLGYKCKYTEPKSVSVVWDRKTVTTDNGVSDEGQNRHKVMGFVGIQTGFGSSGRRRAMRNTWFPSDQQGLQKLEEATGLVFKFVIGRTNDESKMAELRKEVAQYDDFLQLDIEEEYNRLSLLLAKERPHSQTYLGCMKKGPVFTDPKLKWYEPLGYMLGKEYFLHAYGPIYALSADVVMSLVALRNNRQVGFVQNSVNDLS
ncbi:putative beta-1,3-galactosyltransferase 13 [Capsicum baccatum]|uniref:Hexosyltransferase n=1 Tax=Capsicum baccatum TaxID=33114 RepID=A0A2G2WF15_CAPBA|nr:putative beta-1,3-galactosyltransferase 13 [Capsicum baccatum]